MGEALSLVGPPGVGKTTVSGQVVGGLLGVLDSVLGMPIRPARRVLYLAMDRPRQIARSLRRTLGRAQRKLLDDRLVVWEGPPPADLARHPEMLLGLARKANADVVVIDSLKDAALGLTEDETGAGYNRARQLCLANGVEVLELHHLVKRGPNGAKPTTLADVYGSTWITAGSGSVVLLWGSPGDPIVELVHLKQPAEPFGPCKVIHDHIAGTSAVWEGTDLEAIARAAGAKGITAKDAAIVLFSTDKPTPAEVEKARRKLDKITSLTRVDGSRETNSAATWTFTDPSRSGFEREGITDPSRPSRQTEFPQVKDHHADHHDPHADPPSRTPPPLYGGGVKGGADLCQCGNIADPESDRCWRCAA
ncbi:MAG TPA: AAA family ATPase [Mycobacterium sp.]